jgi:hypothetical protein
MPFTIERRISGAVITHDFLCGTEWFAQTVQRFHKFLQLQALEDADIGVPLLTGLHIARWLDAARRVAEAEQASRLCYPSSGGDSHFRKNASGTVAAKSQFETIRRTGGAEMKWSRKENFGFRPPLAGQRGMRTGSVITKTRNSGLKVLRLICTAKRLGAASGGLTTLLIDRIRRVKRRLEIRRARDCERLDCARFTPRLRGPYRGYNRGYGRS